MGSIVTLDPTSKNPVVIAEISQIARRRGVLADLLLAGNLPLRLVEGDADRCCQIEAAGLGLHGHL